MSAHIRRRKSSIDNNSERICLSSSFSKIRSKFPLTQLPTHITSKIFSQLNTNDLINLATMNSQFNQIIQPLLFQSIQLTDDKTKDNSNIRSLTMISSFKGFLQLIYAILSQKDLGLLVNQLKFDDLDRRITYVKLANSQSSIKRTPSANNYWNLKINEILTDYELQFLSSSLSFELNEMTIFDCLVILLSFTRNLSSLSVPSLSLSQIDVISTQLENLKEFTFTLNSNDQFANYTQFKNLTKLRKLTVQFEVGSETQLAALSHSLYQGNVLSHLESLELKYMVVDFNEVVQPTWCSFFASLPNSGASTLFPKLKEFNLLNCQFAEQQATIVHELIKYIPFTQLESMYLKVFEYSHKSKRHDGKLSHFEKDGNTVLCLLTPYLTNLKKLVLKPTKNCLQCQFGSIIQFLSTHQGLTYLSLSLNSLNYKNQAVLKSTLTKYQTQLTKLVLNDEFMTGKIINDLKSWFIHTNLSKFDSNLHYESELVAQSKSESFDEYQSFTFNEFNRLNSNLLVLFIRSFIVDYGLVDSLFSQCKDDIDIKLYGYNFRVIKGRKLIKLNVCEQLGYVDLMYYY